MTIIPPLLWMSNFHFEEIILLTNSKKFCVVEIVYILFFYFVNINFYEKKIKYRQAQKVAKDGFQSKGFQGS